MGRWRLNYTLYRRGSVWYFRSYDLNGNRTSGKSTYTTSKTKARLYCENLLKEGRLFTGKSMLFETFADGFFNEDKDWYKDQLKHKQLAKNTIRVRRVYLNTTIMPFFMDYKLDKITVEVMEKFQDYCAVEKKMVPNTVNNIMSEVKEILQAAMKAGYITSNPAEKVSRIKRESTTHDSFSIEEVKKIINAPWVHWEARSLAMCSLLTGMRIGECRAVRKENIHKGYLDVIDQRIDHENVPLKNKFARKIPLCPEVEQWLRNIFDKDYLYIFDRSAGGIDRVLRGMIKNFGMDPDRSRRLTFHSFRHTFNTLALSKNIPAIKVAAAMGHSTGVSSMQQRYTNFKLEDYAELADFQKWLWNEIQ